MVTPPRPQARRLPLSLVPALLVVLLLLAGLLVPTRAAYAATITVTTTADEFGNGAGCSLREAIQAANTDAAFGGCPAGSGDDTITLPAGTYTLTLVGSADDLNQTGDLDIRSNITMTGAGAASTIVDGNATDRVIEVKFANTLAIAGLTIQHGQPSGSGGGNGAGINVDNNGAIVTITDGIIRDNTGTVGAGIDNSQNGTVTITNSTITGNIATGAAGGGMQNTGVMTITNSTISRNAAVDGEGGGIQNGNNGTLTITSSTLSGNLASSGGGIDNSGTLTITNSTISDNLAIGNQGGGGILQQNRPTTIVNSTFSGNSAIKGGGGIEKRGGSLSLRATVLRAGPVGTNCEGQIDTQGSNVADDGTCFTGGLNGDQVVGDVKLGPLANNGGPTQTHALLGGSPAIDAVVSGCPPPATDQRGVTRPTGLRCDAGAFEGGASQQSLQLSSATYSVSEAGGTATITVTRTGSSSGAVGATLTLSGGTATPSADYIGTTFTVSFADGETSKAVSIPIVNDALDEDDETVNLALSDPTGGAVIGSPSTAVLTIVDDDATPTISINDVTVPDANFPGTNAVFFVTLSAPSGKPVTVVAQTADGTAKAGADYNAVGPLTLTFRPGETIKPLTVPVIDDLLDEDDETFVVNLTSPTNATIAKPQGVATIVDNDDPPTISIDDVEAAEGDTGSTSDTFTITLSAPSAKIVTVRAQTANQTATAGSDYTATGPITLTFNPGETSKTFTVPILGDTLDEPDETFAVNLSNPTNATIKDGQGIGTIVDDDSAPRLFIANRQVIEGDSGTVDLVFPVLLLPASGQTVTVQVQTADDTAQAGSDYTAVGPLTLTFTPGTRLQTMRVPVRGDVVSELDEQFTVNLSNAVNARIGRGQATGTILDDDVATLGINDVTVVEGDSGTVNAVFTVSLNIPSAQTVSVVARTASGTATAGSDYTAVGPITLTFPPGTTSQTISVPVLGDLLDESDETFAVDLGGATNASLRKDRGTGTIRDDDTAAFAIDDVTVVEGNSGSTLAVFTVTLSAASADTVTVVAQTANGTATAGSDYTATGPITLTFPPGTTSQTVSVPVLGDLVDEPNENFAVTLSTASNGSIVRAQGTGTILDDDTATLSIDDRTATEGDAGADDAVFTVRLSTPSSQQITVVVQTANGTATAGSDYTAIGPITLTFPAGTTSQTVSVPILGDTTDEPNETFTVNLSGAVNAAIEDGEAQGTILDDDGQPALFVVGRRVVEGDEGTVDALFGVLLLPASASDVTVTAQTADGSAQAGSDYTATGPTTLTFPAGRRLQIFAVPVRGDTVSEPDETFVVNLSNAVNAGIEKGQATGTILDDDDLPVLGIGNVTVTEGDTGTTNALFTVTLSAANAQTVTVVAQTANGTAQAGSDYTAVGPITLTFAPGDTSQTVAIPVLGDILDEPDETFTVTLSGASNATIETAQAVGTILDDDDPLPALGIGDVKILEGDSGTVDAVFTVSLSAASTQTVTVVAQTANGTATAGSDYTAVGPVTVTFPAGMIHQTVAVPIIGDATEEPDETFTVNLSGASNATILIAQGTGTILNDDGALPSGATPTIAINDVSVTEGNAGTTNAVFAVTLSAASTQTVTVVAQTADGTAQAGSDYTAVGPVTLTFPPGTTNQVVIVPVIGDTSIEADETFTVNLSAPVNATIGDGQGIGTIVNDDGATPPTPTPTPTPVPVKPLDNDDNDKPKETEDERRERQHTNRSNRDQYSLEGNVVEVHQDAEPPYVIVANIDGLVKVVLYCKDQCPTIRVGDYLEADGEKVHEHLFEATDVSVSGPGR